MLKVQVYSHNECKRLHVEPGSSCLDPRQLEQIQTLILLGLSMMEGSVPPSTLKPSLHCVSHYPSHAKRFGILVWYWMMFFERFNKYIKSLCFNKYLYWAMASVAKAYIREATALYQVCEEQIDSAWVHGQIDSVWGRGHGQIDSEWVLILCLYVLLLTEIEGRCSPTRSTM